MRIRDQTPNGEGSRSRNIKKTRIQQAVDSKLCAHTHTHAHPLTSAAQIANASVKQKNPRTIYSTYKKTDSWKKFKRSGTGTNGGVSRATNTGREDLRGSKAFHSSTRRGNKRRNSQNTQPQCNVKQRRAYLAWQHMLKEKKKTYRALNWNQWEMCPWRGSFSPQSAFWSAQWKAVGTTNGTPCSCMQTQAVIASCY